MEKTQIITTKKSESTGISRPKTRIRDQLGKKNFIHKEKSTGKQERQ